MSQFIAGTFTERLAALRSELMLSQSDLASQLGVSRTCYSSWEQGKSKPDLSFLFTLCQIFNVSSDYLIGLSDARHAASPLSIAPVAVPRDPLAGLTAEQRIAIDATLKAYHELNAASKEA